MTIEDLRTQLQAEYPNAGITVGYIGNVERWGDNRSWYVFTKLTPWGGSERLNISFEPKNIDYASIKSRLDKYVLAVK